MAKYAAYVVFVGTEPGVYDDWGEAGSRVLGVNYAHYKGYESLDDAEKAFDKARRENRVKAIRVRSSHNRGGETATAPRTQTYLTPQCPPIMSNETAKQTSLSCPNAEPRPAPTPCYCARHHPQSVQVSDLSRSGRVAEDGVEESISTFVNAMHARAQDRAHTIPRSTTVSISSSPTGVTQVESEDLARTAGVHDHSRPAPQPTKSSTVRPSSARVNAAQINRRRGDSNASDALSYVTGPITVNSAVPKTEHSDSARAKVVQAAPAYRGGERMPERSMDSPTSEGPDHLSPPATDVSVTVSDDDNDGVGPAASVKRERKSPVLSRHELSERAAAKIAALSRGCTKPETEAEASIGLSGRATSTRPRQDRGDDTTCKTIVREGSHGWQIVESHMRSPPSRAARPLPLSQSPRRLKSQPQQLPPSDSRGDAPTPPASPVKPDVRSGTKESSSPETEVTIREPLAFSPDTHISRESIPSQRPVSSPHEIRRERTEPSIGSPRTHRVTRSRTHDLVITQEHSVVSDSRSPREPSMPGVPPDMPLVCVDRYRKYDRYWYSAPRGSEGDSRTQRWVEENALAAREHVETPREPAPLPPNVTVRSPVRVRRERTEPTITSSPRVAQGNVSSKPSSTTVLAARGDDRPRLETSHLGADRTMNTENLPESVSTYRGARGSPVPSAALGSTQASHETPDDFSHTPFTRAHRESGPGSRVSRTSSDPTARGSSGRGADVVERTYSEPNLPPAQGSPARRRVPGGTVPGTPQRIGRPGSFVSTQNEAAALPLPLSPLHGLNLSPPLQHVASEDLDPRSPHSGALVPSRDLVFRRPSPGQSMPSLDSLLFQP